MAIRFDVLKINYLFELLNEMNSKKNQRTLTSRQPTMRAVSGGRQSTNL